jgi:hypothetical protein
MKEIMTKELVVGTTAMMKVGSPVRQWMRVVGRGPKRWLTPLRYVPLQYSLDLDKVPKYVEVGIGAIMMPYAIVYHRIGREWVKLWVDTREVALYRPD